MSIGQIIKARRHELKMTQRQLAAGICTQAMVSKIESDSLNPSSLTIQKISDKLKVPVSYFYNIESLADTQFKQLEKIIRDHLNKAEYNNINYLIKVNEQSIINSNDQYYKSFFKWIEGILEYYIHRNTNNAFVILQEALPDNDKYKELSIDILTTQGVINYENLLFDKACLYYEKAIKYVDDSICYKKTIKVLYNYSLNLESQEKYKESLEIILQGIDLLLSNQSPE